MRSVLRFRLILRICSLETVLRIVLLFGTLCAVSLLSWGHPISQSYLIIRIEETQASCQWLLKPEDLGSSDLFSGTPDVSATDNLFASRKRLQDHLMEALFVSSPEEEPSRNVTRFQLTEDGFLEIRLSFRFEKRPNELRMSQDVAAFMGHPHRVMVSVSDGLKDRELVLEPLSEGGEQVLIDLHDLNLIVSLQRSVLAGVRVSVLHIDLALLLVVALISGSNGLRWSLICLGLLILGRVMAPFSAAPSILVLIEVLSPLMLAFVAAERLLFGHSPVLRVSVLLFALMQGLRMYGAVAEQTEPEMGGLILESVTILVIILIQSGLCLGFVAAGMHFFPKKDWPCHTRLVPFLLVLLGLTLTGLALF